MPTGGTRPDLYVDTAAGLLAYDLSPQSILRLLDVLYGDEPAAAPAINLVVDPTPAGFCDTRRR